MLKAGFIFDCTKMPMGFIYPLKTHHHPRCHQTLKNMLSIGFTEAMMLVRVP
jgi:hypothetical protein